MVFALNFKVILNIVLILGLTISYLIYRYIVKKHNSDPEFEKEEQERIRELREKQRKDAELDEYAARIDAYDNEDNE